MSHRFLLRSARILVGDPAQTGRGPRSASVPVPARIVRTDARSRGRAVLGPTGCEIASSCESSSTGAGRGHTSLAISLLAACVLGLILPSAGASLPNDWR